MKLFSKLFKKNNYSCVEEEIVKNEYNKECNSCKKMCKKLKKCNDCGERKVCHTCYWNRGHTLCKGCRSVNNIWMGEMDEKYIREEKTNKYGLKSNKKTQLFLDV